MRGVGGGVGGPPLRDHLWQGPPLPVTLRLIHPPPKMAQGVMTLPLFHNMLADDTFFSVTLRTPRIRHRILCSTVKTKEGPTLRYAWLTMGLRVSLGFVGVFWARVSPRRSNNPPWTSLADL